jgi:pyrroloquinoline quinone biosynthesis protein B
MRLLPNRLPSLRPGAASPQPPAPRARGRRRPGTSGGAILLATAFVVACGPEGEAPPAAPTAATAPPAPVPSDPLSPVDGQPFVVVLGVGQDGGFPQAGTKDSAAWEDGLRRRLPVSLGIVDPVTGERWMVEATPAFPEQLQALDRAAPTEGVPGLAGILLTHAHVGHYAGLIHLGREIIGARSVPVYAMPRMEGFLRGNGPWDQLVRLENIEIRGLTAGVATALNERIRVTPVLVPHRDEYSETVAFRIEGPERAVLFLPDIDKWEAWDALGTRIEDVLATVEVAWLDATFFGDGEVPGRPMSEIPHPFVVESLERFSPLPAGERAKVRFIHMNRTNPVGWPGTPEWERVWAAGMRVSTAGERVGL